MSDRDETEALRARVHALRGTSMRSQARIESMKAEKAAPLPFAIGQSGIDAVVPRMRAILGAP